jgi:uncharacterized membrane protein HdeD (DUF308 family)
MYGWKRWQDWLAVALGAMLFLAPFVLGVPLRGTAALTAYIGGILLMLSGAWELYRPMDRAGEWVEGLVGIVVFLAPWVLAFTAISTMAWSAWLIGIVAIVLAGSVLLKVEPHATGATA